MSNTEIDSAVAQIVMGWEKVVVDYTTKEPTAELSAQMSDGWFNTPSFAKWERFFELEQLSAVGIYWIDPVARKIMASSNGFDDPFEPSTRYGDAMKVLEKCGEKCMISIVKFESRGKWFIDNERVGGNIWTTADTLPLAICKFSLELFGESK